MNLNKCVKYLIHIFFIYMICGTPLFADMDSFKNSIEKAEKEEQKTQNEEDSVIEQNELAEVIFQLIFLGWGANNLTAIYSDYPYYYEPFIQRDYSLIAPFEVKNMLPPPENKKSWWYSLDFQPFYLSDIGGGSWLTFKGNSWRFFGPYFEAIVLTDTKEIIGALRLGATLSIIQTNPFSLNLYGQWISWFGFLERNGGTFGLETHFYPIKPLSFHFRGGFQTFSHFQISEAELKTSFFSGPREFYLGWRWWDLKDSKQNSIDFWSGPFGGIAWWL
ncbi:MAG TPA: hypothetical protein VJ861_10515 [Treponemataceae bacterium]|nr:hypothetical protein [Treponemataceae bacterium]